MHTPRPFAPDLSTTGAGEKRDTHPNTRQMAHFSAQTAPLKPSPFGVLLSWGFLNPHAPVRFNRPFFWAAPSKQPHQACNRPGIHRPCNEADASNPQLQT